MKIFDKNEKEDTPLYRACEKLQDYMEAQLLPRSFDETIKPRLRYGPFLENEPDGRAAISIGLDWNAFDKDNTRCDGHVFARASQILGFALGNMNTALGKPRTLEVNSSGIIAQDENQMEQFIKKYTEAAMSIPTAGS